MMKKSKTTKLDRSMRYADILNKIESGSEVSIERVGDSVFLRMEEPGEPKEEPFHNYEPEAPKTTMQKQAPEAPRVVIPKQVPLEDRYEASEKSVKVSFDDIQELIVAFSKLDEKLASLEVQVRSLRQELGMLKNASFEKFYRKSAEPEVETTMYEKRYEDVGEEAIQIKSEVLGGKVEEASDIVASRVREKPGFKLDFITAPLVTLYNWLSPAPRREEEYERRDDSAAYRKFQKKLFYLVREGPKSLEEIAEATGESKLSCFRWLRRMVGDGLLEETRSETRPRKMIYKIIWKKEQV